MLTRRGLLALSATSAFAPAVLSRSARAEAGTKWPDRTVHMIVPIAAGGPTDSNARIVAEQLTKFWGQQVVIDNKGGAGTNIGNEFVAHSDPDGYTILYGTSSLSSNGALYRALSYSPTKDLAPVSMVSKFPFFMFAQLLAGENRQGIYRLRQIKARQTHHGIARHRQRSASRRGAVHEHGPH